jgi:predicted  nucleic acid-binding Zn-ribbon protein
MSEPIIRCLTCGERFREKPLECPVCRQNKFEARADLATPDQGLPAESEDDDETEPETEDDEDDLEYDEAEDDEDDLEDDEDEMPPPKPPPKPRGRPSGGRPSTKRKR